MTFGDREFYLFVLLIHCGAFLADEITGRTAGLVFGLGAQETHQIDSITFFLFGSGRSLHKRRYNLIGVSRILWLGPRHQSLRGFGEKLFGSSGKLLEHVALFLRRRQIFGLVVFGRKWIQIWNFWRRNLRKKRFLLTVANRLLVDWL